MYLAVWLFAAFFVAPRLGSLVGQNTGAVPPVLLLAGAAPAVVLVALALSSSFRRTLAAAALPAVIGVQVYRVIGAVFAEYAGSSEGLASRTVTAPPP